MEIATKPSAGKSYASIIDDEKAAFQRWVKKPATFIIAGFPAMEGRRKRRRDWLAFALSFVYNSVRQT